MFDNLQDNLQEELDKDNIKKFASQVRPKVENPTNLYTKKFTKAEWENLDVVVDGLPYNTTIQDVLNAKYSIEIIEGSATKTPLEQEQLELNIKQLQTAYDKTIKDANKMKEKFLFYAEQHYHWKKFILQFEFKDIELTFRNGKSPKE